MEINLKHIRTDKKRLASGRIVEYHYHRLTGKRIKGEPGTLEFHASYEEAAKRERQKRETFGGLVADFFESKIFENLGERTKADYAAFRNIVEPEWGSAPLAVFEDKRIKGDFMKWRDKLASKRSDRQADLIFAFARRVVSFGVDPLCVLSANHLTGIPAIYKADRSDIIWLPEHVDALWAVASPIMKLALILALNLGRRLGDLVKLKWGDYKGDFILVTNRKGRRKIQFPARVTASLRNSLDAYKASLKRPVHIDETILTTPTGKPWTEHHFSIKFGIEKNSAGLTDLHFHDLRGTAITVLAENGSTTSEIASISGHSLKQVEAILEKYMARTRALNDAASRKLEKSWIATVGL